MDKTIPSADMRGIYFVSDIKQYYYYVKKGKLCFQCGCVGQCVLSDAKVVTSCSLFQPVISFIPPLGNVDAVFNTFRLGKAWVKRVEAGSVVSLMNMKTKTIFREATVVKVESGSLDDICFEYARDNHMLKGESYSQVAASTELKAILRRCYGKLFYDSAKYVTAIYLKGIAESQQDSTSG